jgi:hypothetical protein
MVNKTANKWIILAGLAVLALVVLFICRATRPPTDQARYAYLHRFGRTFERIRKGKTSVPNWVEAGLHFSTPSSYYRSRMEAQAKALLASGYLAETEVPVADLQPRCAQVFTILSNTAQLSGAYYEAKLDWRRDKVILVCRKQDVPLWMKALENGAPQ